MQSHILSLHVSYITAFPHFSKSITLNYLPAGRTNFSGLISMSSEFFSGLRRVLHGTPYELSPLIFREWVSLEARYFQDRFFEGFMLIAEDELEDSEKPARPNPGEPLIGNDK